MICTQATSVPWSLPQVRLPAALERAMKLGSIVNLSLISFSKAECFGDVTYFHELLFATLFPAAVVALILAVAFRRGPRMGGEERSRALAGALYWVCFALFIFVPGTSSSVWKSNLQPDFNVRVCECFDTSTSAVLRELDESDRSVQKSAESTSI